MADSDMSMTTRTAPVLIALEALAAKYDSRWREEYYSDADEENKVRTRDELDQKTKLLDEFRSILLPSIKHQLKSLSTAVLDRPQNNNEYSSLDIELTLETLSNLDRTIQKSSCASAPVPSTSVDRKMPTTTTQNNAKPLGVLMWMYGSKILSGASDFALLQRNWQCTVRSLDELLETLASLIDCRQNDRSALRRSVTLSFTLDTELNSDTLYTLDQDPASILYPCQVYTVHLEESHKANSMISSSHSMRNRINWMSRSVDSTVVLLALYIIPLSPQIDHSSLQSDFKAWLFEWQRLWHIAKNRLVGAILLPEPEN
ncbi:hypothetical protein Pst134EA_032806 [Puccinia striiformis f. sp. tritici]|uniref:uncharacterized protein n=1 Tax=Puccinia striiformis f. sp. tritici TaxID=168172 RepID=UPI00200873E0|nr:uncharacterized protein Pst134EA_032806 [Puccinia striiformis f. sp. tritici]KAH9443509.1 hypothetical protein Pst134EA_032806 [Puccinia striiformis f. sp. tritici]